jgi:hypothetical protein
MVGGIYGIICIKDTYVVCKYVKKTVFGMGFRHLPVVASTLDTPIMFSFRYTCITIIDTIILHIHTNDAYYYVTPTCGSINDRHSVYVLIGYIYVVS